MRPQEGNVHQPISLALPPLNLEAECMVRRIALRPAYNRLAATNAVCAHVSWSRRPAAESGAERHLRRSRCHHVARCVDHLPKVGIVDVDVQPGGRRELYTVEKRVLLLTSAREVADRYVSRHGRIRDCAAFLGILTFTDDELRARIERETGIKPRPTASGHEPLRDPPVRLTASGMCPRRGADR
jgi:hypothetical protein